jgi:hypothetical protein
VSWTAAQARSRASSSTPDMGGDGRRATSSAVAQFA